jgi:hypothetical protein
MLGFNPFFQSSKIPTFQFLFVNLRLLEPTAEIPVDHLPSAKGIQSTASASCLFPSIARMFEPAEGQLYLRADRGGIDVNNSCLEIPLGDSR